MHKFRDLLKLFVGTHSFHNYASTKGRQLKEVRKRVQASIDLKKAGGGAQRSGGDGETSAPGEGEERSQERSQEENPVDGGGGGTKRWRSKEEWRTYRHKKKSAGDQKIEDDWYGKTKQTGETEAFDAGARSPQAPQAEPAAVSSASGDGVDERPEIAAAQIGEESGDGEAVKDGGADAAGVLPGTADGARVSKEEEGDGAPERVLMLRELRTK